MNECESFGIEIFSCGEIVEKNSFFFVHHISVAVVVVIV